MRKSFLVALVITGMLGGTYWYTKAASLCPIPLHYKIGEVDKSFALTKEQARAYTASAEAVWENRTGRQLFVYDEQADFSINFVYDDRQGLVDQEKNERDLLDSKQRQNEITKSKLEELQAQYDKLSSSYENKLVSYESRLKDYNEEVGKYNDRGGAPPEIYAELEAERQSLASEVTDLSRVSNKLNALTESINKLAEQGNQLINDYNAEVNSYNMKYGYVREFTQGDYQGDRIDVYKFSNEAELVTVLTHEFGHALGIDHVADDSSVMYYLLRDDLVRPVPLSDDDIAAFEAVCGTETTWLHRIKKFIQNLNN